MTKIPAFADWLRRKGHDPDNISAGLRGAMRDGYESQYPEKKRKPKSQANPKQQTEAVE